jgi:dihydrolipoamide dehydrogenase
MAGDVDGERPVLHEASLQGVIAGRNAATFPEVRPGKRAVPLSIMFTDPPLATVGGPPSDSTIVGVGSYDNQGRAKIDACAAGLVRIYTDGASGAITGAILLGPAMDHIAIYWLGPLSPKRQCPVCSNSHFIIRHSKKG